MNNKIIGLFIIALILLIIVVGVFAYYMVKLYNENNKNDIIEYVFSGISLLFFIFILAIAILSKSISNNIVLIFTILFVILGILMSITVILLTRFGKNEAKYVIMTTFTLVVIIAIFGVYLFVINKPNQTSSNEPSNDEPSNEPSNDEPSNEPSNDEPSNEPSNKNNNDKKIHNYPDPIKDNPSNNEESMYEFWNYINENDIGAIINYRGFINDNDIKNANSSKQRQWNYDPIKSDYVSYVFTGDPGGQDKFNIKFRENPNKDNGNRYMIKNNNLIRNDVIYGCFNSGDVLMQKFENGTSIGSRKVGVYFKVTNENCDNINTIINAINAIKDTKILVIGNN